MNLFMVGSEKCETLTNVVVKLSGDPCALLLLCLNHPAAHTCEGRFRQLTVGEINAGSDITDKRAFLVEPRHSDVENPSIFSVVPPKPVLHSELLTAIKRLCVDVHASPHILGVNSLYPAVSKLGVHRSPGEVQPRLIKIGAELVGT